MSLQEGYDESIYESKDIEMPEDESGFGDSVFGVDKMSRPSEEGFATARNAFRTFANDSDGKDTNIKLNIDVAMPEDTSGFDESFIMEEDDLMCDGGECVDPYTIPAVPEEDDQFSDPDEDEEAAIGSVSDEELASDDDFIGESVTGWDDLF